MNKIDKLIQVFTPEHYELSLDINESSLKFSGSVVISGEIKEESLRLHSRGLTITRASVNDQAVEVGKENQHSEILLSGDYGLGAAKIELEFIGDITAKMLGIYPSNFSHNGEDKKIIATQFEAHYAREAFPCIDEPEAKATFTLSLTTDANSVVTSNMLPSSEKTTGDRKATIFKKSPKMSSYLLAFATGDMQMIEAKTRTGTLVRSFSSVAQPLKNLQYSLDEGIKILEFFEDYFKTPYPLEKCDQIALPDFDAGAMENWGMITYREIAMLADPDNRSISSEQYISLVIAHELSHQWFGNLVTMKWWDDLWLNESFASLMEHIALDSLHPDWKQWEIYTASDVLSTTSRDIHKDIQPVKVEVDNPDMIETLFDPGIVYAKGGRLLKMLREYIGEDVFVAGLHDYFKAHAYSNATSDDLWQCMSDSSGLDIKKLMNEWLTKPGMPVLTVRKTDTGLAISQERFLVDGTDEDSIWPVPLLASGEVNPNILSGKTGTFTTADDEHPIINQYGSGHYFVAYDSQEHKAEILTRIKQGEIPSEARINTLNDMIMLSRSGHSKLPDALDLVAAMKNEDRFNVWALMSRVVGTAQQMTEGDETAREQFSFFKRSLSRDLHKELGWDDQPNDDPNTIQLRSMMISLMLGTDDEAALAHAKEMVQKTDKLEDLPAENRIAILGSQVRHGDVELIERLMKLYPESTAEMQTDIHMALAANRNPNFAEDILSRAIGKGGFVRNQDLMRWIVYFLRNHYVRDVMWDMLNDDWPRLEKILKDSKSFDFLPVYASQIVSTDQWAKKYTSFFKPHLNNPILKKNITIGLVDVKARVAWRNREEPQIKKWLSDNPFDS